ncbi:ABC transporter permease [Paenibacillus algicola]|uniref:ABC transporter permease n=1 Tax=Paenibacillus algicola TaxID=2565926 RepID=A0A4P8XKR0_9BACL|nr:nickel/cobalt ABC transporter permease [Paenibacillus algicola]QCT02933.1 ABC transporter permease [Paenibacillus algicola]
MLRYVSRRWILSIPLLVIISFLTFVLIHLSPMKPAQVVLQAQGVPVITEELIIETEQRLGLDRPFLLRFGDWLLSCLKLDFGDSYVTGQTVWSMLSPALWNTLKLTLVSMVAIVTLSIVLGVICALKAGSWVDHSVRSVSFFLTAMPAYALAALLIWLFSIRLDLLPTSGMDSIQSYVLPVIIITTTYAGLYFRVIRTSMLNNLNQNYVLYGRACGLPESKIILSVLRNSLQVAVSVFCMAVPIILGSTVVVENIFAWPGLGSLSVRAILGRDFPVIQAFVLVLAAAFVIFNTFSDTINAVLNPKSREGM